jgi:hypothetical protein
MVIILSCGNTVPSIIQFLDVAKFATLTPLLLIISCNLKYEIVSLKISSLSTTIISFIL